MLFATQNMLQSLLINATSPEQRKNTNKPQPTANSETIIINMLKSILTSLNKLKTNQQKLFAQCLRNVKPKYIGATKTSIEKNFNAISRSIDIMSIDFSDPYPESPQSQESPAVVDGSTRGMGGNYRRPDNLFSDEQE